MAGRTMYVIPYSMGVMGSRDLRRSGIEITDSPYVVAKHAYHGARRQAACSSWLGENGEFVRGLHSVGRSAWPGGAGFYLALQHGPQIHLPFFPENTRESGRTALVYGGNALLGKKCPRAADSLRCRPRDEGWMAEHMLILKLISPSGQVKYMTGAFPSACGKTNLSMLIPTIPGWKVETIGDDIAWMKFGPDGRLHAINPEYGFFGVAPGTSMKSNANAMLTVTKNSHFSPIARATLRRRRLVGRHDRGGSQPN